MRKLTYSVDLEHFEQIKKEIVPSIFTEHQFNLIHRKFSGKVLTLRKMSFQEQYPEK